MLDWILSILRNLYSNVNETQQFKSMLYHPSSRKYLKVFPPKGENLNIQVPTYIPIAKNQTGLPA